MNDNLAVDSGGYLYMSLHIASIMTELNTSQVEKKKKWCLNIDLRGSKLRHFEQSEKLDTAPYKTYHYYLHY